MFEQIDRNFTEIQSILEVPNTYLKKIDQKNIFGLSKKKSWHFLNQILFFKLKIFYIKLKAQKSKKTSHNYGKLVVKTNDSNISFQISFNAVLNSGSVK